ncbi:MAG: MATE family efflux transporter, partial [Oscillospiraceae bacterium]
EMAVLVLIGLGVGIQPLLGYSYGARNYSRLKEILKKAMLLQVAIGIVFFIIFSLYARELVTVFQKIPEVIDTATIILNALKTSIPILGVLFVIMSTNQSMGNVKAALLLSVVRQGIIYIPALFLLNKYIGFKGFIYAQPISDIGSVIIAAILLIGVFREIESSSQSMDFCKDE